MHIGLGISPTIPMGVAIPAFSPTSISGLQLWLDASDSSTLFQNSNGTTPATADGDPVGYWADKSGNGRHATQTDGTKKPTLKLAQENGKNVIQFDNVNDLFSGTAGSQYPRQCFYVVRFPLSATDCRIMTYRYFGVGLSSATSYNLNIVRDGVAWNVNTLVSAINYANTNKYLIELLKSSQSSDQLNVNTTAYASYNNSTVVSSSAYQIFQAGKVCEYLVYDQSLSSNQKTSIQDYLNTKWSIY